MKKLERESSEIGIKDVESVDEEMKELDGEV